MPQGSSASQTSLLTLNVTPSRSTGKTTDLRLSASGAKASKRDIRTGIVPDSEEERRRCSNLQASEIGKENEIVVISSDDDEEYKHSNADSFIANIPGSWSVANIRRNTVSSTVTATKNSPSSRTAKISTKYRPSRRIIESSDSEVAGEIENEIIELTDSDDEDPKFALDVDSDDSDSHTPLPLHDEAILVLDYPRNRRKLFPLRNDKLETSSASSTPQRPVGMIEKAADVQLTPASAAAMSSSRRQPRTGKKAEAAAKLERLKTYALNRFADLNEKVFDNKIPNTTKIEWNCRFTTTAGKASYRKDREGVVYSKIELAIKILDAEERIDRTLSHEMCHLASWIISTKIDEYHGSIFKGWAAKVERICPGIVVSTTHDYEINHPWKWKCDFCSNTYGRFTKSINTEVKGCGACKQGRLIPMFEQRTKSDRNPGTPRVSRMAASRTRDSPSVLARSGSGSPTKLSTSGHSDDGQEVVCIHGSESESEQERDIKFEDPIEILITKMGSTNLSA
ncbi:SprT-like family-domain-containing protein [Lentinula aciculospora]|uniref:SprT-like family-domain-containing protein n=1 Tax=Lentinula aciculospora TaxID=153920 RepID=A0A9W9AN65_9AGAR|nr:SprT-like family-domain-containing protein [Lentinula aciculospora]